MAKAIDDVVEAPDAGKPNPYSHARVRPTMRERTPPKTNPAARI